LGKSASEIIYAALDDFQKWMDENDHNPTIGDDYGGHIVECSNRGCVAGVYDWISTHVEEYKRDLT
jgi:hypothetical protein